MPHIIEPTDDWKQTIARNFSALLIDEIGQFNTLEVIAANEKEADPNVCHSHDFTDANELMELAFATDGFDTEDAALWLEVWTIARTNDFFIDAD